MIFEGVSLCDLCCSTRCLDRPSMLPHTGMLSGRGRARHEHAKKSSELEAQPAPSLKSVTAAGRSCGPKCLIWGNSSRPFVNRDDSLLDS
jgi:hypothetical protein